MAFYTYDHIHLLSPEPMETARYFNEMFGARIVESVQSDGNPRVDLDLNGLEIFIARCAEDTTPSADHPHQGLDHFGLRVENLDAAAAELKAKGALSSRLNLTKSGPASGLRSWWPPATSASSCWRRTRTAWGRRRRFPVDATANGPARIKAIDPRPVQANSNSQKICAGN